MSEERRRLSRHSELAGAMDYMLKRWASFTRFLEDGRFALTTTSPERALRGPALGRKPCLFAGSDRGGAAVGAAAGNPAAGAVVGCLGVAAVGAATTPRRDYYDRGY